MPTRFVQVSEAEIARRSAASGRRRTRSRARGCAARRHPEGAAARFSQTVGAVRAAAISNGNACSTCSSVARGSWPLLQADLLCRASTASGYSAQFRFALIASSTSDSGQTCSAETRRA